MRPDAAPKPQRQPRSQMPLYTELADVLLLPRRYAGSCLTMQEAAGCGLPIISLNLEPQNEWIPVSALVPARPHRNVAMVGGRFQVHTAEAKLVAEAMDRLSADRELVAYLSGVSRGHAESISWTRWAPLYTRLLENAARLRSVL